MCNVTRECDSTVDHGLIAIAKDWGWAGTGLYTLICKHPVKKAMVRVSLVIYLWISFYPFLTVASSIYSLDDMNNHMKP